MRTYSRKIPFCALIGVLFFVSACKKYQGTLEEQSALSRIIKIGLPVSLTGAEASYGKDTLQGARLAVEEINANGGVLGRQIHLVIKDNQSKPGENSVVVRDLIHRHHVSALVGEGASGRTLEAAPIAQKSRIPLISSASTNEKVTKVGNYIFRMCFTDSFQGQVMAKFARSLGIRNVAIVLDNSKDYSIGLAQNFSKDFVALGGQIAVQQNYNGSDKDFSAQLTAVKASRPDAIFLPSYYTEASLIISQARQLGLDVPFLGGDGWDSAEFLQMGGNAVENVYFSDHFSAENTAPRVQNFVKNYEQKYETPPSALAALAYDAINLLADALRRARTVDPIKIRDALVATHNFPAVTGTLNFDHERSPTKPAVIIQVRKGKFTYLQTMEL